MRRGPTSLLATLLSRLGARRNATSVTIAKPEGRFQAVAIYRGAICCEMARRFSEHRFLSREVPALPLKLCTMPQNCECRYLRFKDRRGPQRRAGDFGSARRNAVERRLVRGRRSAD
jgi:hypothetical protein